MKKLLFALICFIATISVIAQTKSAHLSKFYLSCGGGPANHNGAFAEFAATAAINKSWTASVSYNTVNMDPKNLPSNYEPGYTLLLIFPIPDAMPSQEMRLLNFTVGKMFETGRTTWFTAEGGLSVASGKSYQFTAQDVKSDWFYTTSNYSTEKKSQTTIGGAIRTDFNWAFCPFAGMGIGAFANLNSIQSPIGFELKLTAGWLNTKRKLFERN